MKFKTIFPAFFIFYSLIVKKNDSKLNTHAVIQQNGGYTLTQALSCQQSKVVHGRELRIFIDYVFMTIEPFDITRVSNHRKLFNMRDCDSILAVITRQEPESGNGSVVFFLLIQQGNWQMKKTYVKINSKFRAEYIVFIPDSAILELAIINHFIRTQMNTRKQIQLSFLECRIKVYSRVKSNL